MTSASSPSNVLKWKTFIRISEGERIGTDKI